VARSHQRLEYGQIRHEARGGAQRRFPLRLQVAKSRDGILEVVDDALTGSGVDGVLHDEQGHRRQSGGCQQHGDLELGSKPNPTHAISRLSDYSTNL
jgi:hypothetical protein